MDILGKLFGSENRVKIIRLFLLNPEEIFETKEISQRSKVRAPYLRREISLLSKINFIRQKTIKKGVKGWQLSEIFPYLLPLRNLTLNAAPINTPQLIKKIKSAVKPKLVILSGIFIQEDNSRVDMLIVGDAMKKNKLDKVIQDIESKVGKELDYAFFETKEFLYRMGMYDRLVRDILDYPHEKVLNTLNV